MIIKIFKISTMEMWILRNKNALIDFIEMETNVILPKRLSIKQLMQFLPETDYDRME